jgi:thioredoxin-like negative regulator of GroEL
VANKVLDIDEGRFNEILKDADKLIIVEFYTNTCPNCRAIEPTYEKLSVELSKNAIFTKINAESNTILAGKLGVLGVPTFKFFCSGLPIAELVGSINATLLRNTIKDLIRHRSECVANVTKLTYEIDGYG